MELLRKLPRNHAGVPSISDARRAIRRVSRIEPSLTALVTQTRIPVLAAAFGRGVENGPERIEIRRAARVLAGIGGGHSHFAGPEMTDRAVAPREHVVAGHVGIFAADIIARVVARWIRINLVPGPAARLLGL